MSLEIFHYKVARNIKSCYTMKVAIKLIKYDYFIRRSIEVVITSCTRNFAESCLFRPPKTL